MSEAPEGAVEAGAVIASARALLEELIEEGVDCFERVAFDSAADRDASEPGGAPESRQAPAPREAGEPAASGAASGLAEPIKDAGSSGSDEQAVPAMAPQSLLQTEWGPSPSLEDVRGVLGDCTRCPLCERRRNIVFGDGNPDADLMFIGEGPGENEDIQGLPFVGRAGELLTQMIESGLGISRSEVYICNIVKCRPPRNRNPLPPEVSACRPFLDGQIDAIRPKVIVTLGKPAAGLLLGREVAITRIRGTWQSYRGIPLMPTLHPAFVLRQYTAENRRNVWEDLKAALARTRE